MCEVNVNYHHTHHVHVHTHYVYVYSPSAVVYTYMHMCTCVPDSTTLEGQPQEYQQRTHTSLVQDAVADKRTCIRLHDGRSVVQVISE